LVQFDPTPFEQEVARLEGELKARDAVVNSYQHLLELEKSQVNNVVAGAEYNRREAKQDESRLQDYVRKIKLIPGGAKTFSTEIDQAEKKLTQQEAKVTKLDADFQQAQKEAVFKIANAMANLEKAKIERETTRSLLDTARGELSKTTVVAPMAGIVVHMEMLRENQKRKPRVGDVIWYNQPILYLPNLSEMLVRTLVRENDLHRVRTGQRASAKVDAFPDLALEGFVKSIGVLASEQSPGRQEGEKYFQVVIALKGSDVRLRPGMSARAFIHGDSAPNTLSVPISSIFPEGGKRFCFVRKGNTFIRREVSIGLEGDELVQIRQGLTEGEQVTLVRPDSWEGR
jgi:HlyD family secretion protein